MGQQNNEWPGKQIQQLQKLYDKLCSSEVAISSYIYCVTRMLNGIAQIYNTSFHRYEKIILDKPMQVFTMYFIEEIKSTVKEEKDALEKKRDIEDIERAVCKISEVYENVINSTSSADKQIFMSLPVSSSVYGASPKLYALYSQMLEKLINIFDDEDNRKYSFVLYPSIRRLLQTEILFERRKMNGKVVIIYIPAIMLEDTDILPVYLFHEVFHVLTIQERCREKRLSCIIRCLMIQLLYWLFHNVVYVKENTQKDIYIKKVILGKIFQRTKSKYDDYVNKAKENPRLYYGSNVTAFLYETIGDDINHMLEYLDGEYIDDIFKEMAEEHQNKDVVFDQQIRNVIDTIDIIKNNLKMLQWTNRLDYFIHQLVFLFKEMYADLACLRVVLDPKLYRTAFDRSIQFSIREEDRKADDYRKLREVLVTYVYENQEKKKGEMCDAINKMFGVATLEKKDYKLDLQSEDGSLFFNNDMINLFCEYLDQCYKKLDATFSVYPNNKKLDELSSLLKEMQKKDPTFIKDVLLGEIF